MALYQEFSRGVRLFDQLQHHNSQSLISVPLYFSSARALRSKRSPLSKIFPFVLSPSLSFRVTARLAPRKERKGPMGAGFEASEQQGEAYILTGEQTVQLQRAENAILLRIQMSHGALGTGSASQVRLSGFVSGIVVGDLLDLFELLDEAGLSNRHSRLVHSTVKQGYQRQCENAGKRMDAKQLVGPMVGRGKTR